MATLLEDDLEEQARETRTQIRFVDPGDFVTRRFVSAGKEMNTGTYSDHEVTVRDGMPIRDHFTLDTHGFLIAKNPSAVKDFHDKAQVDALYEREVEEHVRQLTGADRVVARGQVRRRQRDVDARPVADRTDADGAVEGHRPPLRERQARQRLTIAGPRRHEADSDQ